MFWRKKDKKNKIIEKVFMGAIIGGAIGSVIGASIAPKRGEETRKDIAQGAKSLFKKAKDLILKKAEPEEDSKKIPQEHV